jgi:hypothetical protein
MPARPPAHAGRRRPQRRIAAVALAKPDRQHTLRVVALVADETAFQHRLAAARRRRASPWSMRPS